MKINNIIQEEINKYLGESPDGITNYNNLFRFGDEIHWDDTDAHGFGYVNGNLIVTDNGDSHGSMKGTFGHLKRDDYKYGGRVWTFNKIISFWEYPKPSELHRILNDLNHKLNIKIDDTWLIETLPNAVNDKEGRGVHFDWKNNTTIKLLSPSQYEQLDNVQQLSPEERANPHPFSPTKPIKGSGSDKYGKEMPLPYRQAIVRSEGKKLEESPDKIYFPKGPPYYGKELDWGYAGNDYAFGYDKKTYDLLISKPGNTHRVMLDNNNRIVFGVNRSNLNYAGRIWTKDKIISFWEFPPTYMIKDLLRDLEDRLNIKILGMPDWKIETLEDMVNQDTENIDDFHWEDRAHSEMDNGVSFVSPDEYANLDNIQQRSDAERAKPHPYSPTKPIKGSGSDKYGKEMPLPYRQALRQEGIEDIVNEELLGDYAGRWTNEKRFEIYKNPKSIKRMDSSIRGIVDKEGNLYVANVGESVEKQGVYAATTHQEIEEFLMSKGYLEKDSVSHENGIINYIGVHRHEKTNDFYFGESDSYTFLNNENFMLQAEEIFKKAKQKNPTLNFIMRDIWGD